MCACVHVGMCGFSVCVVYFAPKVAYQRTKDYNCSSYALKSAGTYTVTVIYEDFVKRIFLCNNDVSHPR